MAVFKSDYNEQLTIKLTQQYETLRQQLPVYSQEFVKDFRRRRQIKTTIAYLRELIDFYKFLKEVNPMYKDIDIKDIPLSDLDALTFHDINEYQDYLEMPKGETMHSKGASAINRSMSALSVYFKFLVVHGYLSHDPTLGATKGRKAPRKPIERLSNQQVVKLLDGVERSESGSERSRAFTVRSQLRDTAIITLLLGTGIRISEIVGLDIEHIDLDEQSMQVVRKGGDIERVYFNNDVKKALVDYISIERKADPKTGPLFLSSRGTRLAVYSMQKVVKKYGIANLSTNLHPHTLRKTFGTNLYNETGDIYLVADALGHKDVSVTQQFYAAMNEEHKAQNKELYLYNRKEKNENEN